MSSLVEPVRLMNSQPGPYWNYLKKNTPQASVFLHGQPHPPGFEGATPMWVNVDFPSVAAYETQDNAINLPEAFKLFGINGFSFNPANINTKYPFSVLLYDVNRQVALMERALRGDMALGAAPGFMIESRTEPYAFDPDSGQVFMRVTNLSANAAYIAVALVGISGGENG